MIMPLSRYISGDFITPNMRQAWEHGVPYAIIGPEGPRILPEGLPFGGPGAPAHRAKIFEMLMADLAGLPAPIPDQLWDEKSAAEPGFHRVAPDAYQALLEEAGKVKRSFFGLFEKAAPTHLTASLFLPCDFDRPFQMASPLERPTASAVRALQELDAGRWPSAAASALGTLRDALTEATELRLPMIVDY